MKMILTCVSMVGCIIHLQRVLMIIVLTSKLFLPMGKDGIILPSEIRGATIHWCITEP